MTKTNFSALLKLNDRDLIARELDKADRAIFEIMVDSGSSFDEAIREVVKCRITHTAQPQTEAAPAAEDDTQKSLRDRFCDSYNDYIEHPHRAPHIMDALAAIAAFFYDDSPELRRIDRDTGEVGDQNALQYEQRGVMRNFCFQTARQLEGGPNFKGARKRLEELHYYAERASRQNAGDEIGQLQQHAADTDFARQKYLTVPTLEDFMSAATVAYDVLYDEPWNASTKRIDNVDARPTEDRIAHIQPRRSRL